MTRTCAKCHERLEGSSDDHLCLSRPALHQKVLNYRGRFPLTERALAIARYRMGA